MNIRNWTSFSFSPRWRFFLAALGALGGSAAVFAQAAPGPDAAALARYDLNHNGRFDPDELALQAADAGKAPAPVRSDAAAPDRIGVVELSPFQVSSGSDRGYYASNTVSGTRLNSRIEDLGSSISVVTKEQMQDFAMLDINDLFAYEASTEGTGNYTDFTVDRNGMVTDNIQDNPQGANRVRGGGAANIALDNFASSGRVPIDPIGIDAVEISRGPNSSIFGLGQGSGTVNLVSARANLTRESSTAEIRTDDLGGYRASLDLNRPLVRDKLALRASAVYQHDAYNQKPSGGTTHRYNFFLQAHPFKDTTVRGSFQVYDYYGTRPGTVTPRDAVTYWKHQGSPVWDPLTSTLAVNGVSTVYGTSTPSILGPTAFTDPGLFVDSGGLALWEIQRMPAATATNGPNNTAGTPRLLETIADPIRTGHPLYATVRGISSKDLYDWSSINLAGINSIKDHNETTTIELEQTLLRTERQQLAAQLGWNRERASRLNKNVVGQSSATGNSNYLYVDVNQNLLDGRPNPYFLRPYLGVGEPIHSSTPYLRDTFRGQLAYILNFSQDQKWTRWLGRHQLLSYGEERLTKQHTYRFRDVNITDNPIYAPAGQNKGNQSASIASPQATRGYYRFYVGDAAGQNVDYGPGAFAYGQYAFNWFNPQTNSWVADRSTLGESAIQEGSAGAASLQNLIKTRGLVLQSSLLQDRLVFTFGKRHDDNYNKFQLPAVLKPDGYEFDYAAMDGWVGDWAYTQGDTTTSGVVAKPFRGWKAIDRQAAKPGAAGFLASVLQSLNFHYNKSDSFTPESPALSVTFEQLPNPTANGKDYGFAFNLWGDKLVARFNHYINTSVNTRNGQAGVFGNRVLRLDIARFAGSNDAIGLQRQARNWVAFQHPEFSTAQIESAVYQIMGLTEQQVATYNNSTIGETQDLTAKGNEFELNYNPDRFWTFKLNVTQTESIDSNIAPHIPAYIAERLPIWTSIIDPRTGTPWFTTPYSGDAPAATGQTAQSFLQANVTSPIALAQATQGKSRPQIREWHYNAATSLRLAKYFADNRVLRNLTVGGGLRWESPGAIGYYGIPINGDYSVATQYDPNRPIYDQAHLYVDAFAAYNTRLFNDKVRARFQLNARNLQEWHARLQPVGSYPDGSSSTFRVVDPVTFILTASFDL